MIGQLPRPPDVHVLLPVHNRVETTRACLERLMRQSARPAQIVVIDDGSTDGTAEMVSAVSPEAHVLRGDGSLWWAGCLRKGLEYLAQQGVPAGDFVLMLNDDTHFDDRFIEGGARALSAAPSSMLLAQAYSSRDGTLIEVGVRVEWRGCRFRAVSDIAQVNCFSTRGLFIRLGDALRAGGFRPRLLPHYFSDYEFTLRAARRGVRFITDPEVRLVVQEEATGRRGSDTSSPRAYLRSVFSKHSIPNPLYWTSFLLMACPLRHLPANLFQVWVRFLLDLRKSVSANRGG